jgi:hypothetical protein
MLHVLMMIAALKNYSMTRAPLARQRAAAEYGRMRRPGTRFSVSRAARDRKRGDRVLETAARPVVLPPGHLGRCERREELAPRRSANTVRFCGAASHPEADLTTLTSGRPPDLLTSSRPLCPEASRRFLREPSIEACGARVFANGLRRERSRRPPPCGQLRPRSAGECHGSAGMPRSGNVPSPVGSSHRAAGLESPAQRYACDDAPCYPRNSPGQAGQPRSRVWRAQADPARGACTQAVSLPRSRAAA